MVNIAMPGNFTLDNLFYWLSQTVYITRMQLVITVIATAVFSWIASRMFSSPQ